MRRAAVFFVLGLVVVSRGRPLAARPDEITPATVAAIQRWVTAVQEHVPGQRDPPVEMVSALTFAERQQMNVGMEFFLSFVKGNPQVVETTPEERLAHLAVVTKRIPGAEVFLKRAAMLHADTAFRREIDGLKSSEPAVQAPPDAPYAPLLSQRSLSLNRDGEILGDTLSDWNWPFARSLLVRLSPTWRPRNSPWTIQPVDDPFVGTWYHATSAFMFQRGLYGELFGHLRSAAAVLPDDARALFDRACYAELQGLPRIQVLLAKTPAGSSLALSIPDEDNTNDEAERLFRRAVRADPSFVEARVRLGRLLGLRKRHADAASELATALAANPTGRVLFYAHLFAGRSAQALGKIADAVTHYKSAAQLFPGAQSAQLALSQAVLLEADVSAALDSVQRLDRSTTARDPWWSYHLASGRDLDALLREMWNQARKLERGSQ